jgi:hypothetical protein
MICDQRTYDSDCSLVSDSRCTGITVPGKDDLSSGNAGHRSTMDVESKVFGSQPMMRSDACTSPPSEILHLKELGVQTTVDALETSHTNTAHVCGVSACLKKGEPKRDLEALQEQRGPATIYLHPRTETTLWNRRYRRRSLVYHARRTRRATDRDLTPPELQTHQNL